MLLDDLEDLFDDLDFDEPTPDQLYRMYGIFLNDIVNNPIVLNGKLLKYNRKKSKHPVCRGKAQAFEHIITRESKISGKRDFDREKKSGGGLMLAKEGNNSYSIGGQMVNTDDNEDGTVRCFSFVQGDKAVVLGSSFSLKK